MKYFFALLLLASSVTLAQRPSGPKVKVTGKIIEKTTQQPLEYATVAFYSGNNPKAVAGGVSDSKGEFSIDVPEGTYNIIFEFISFESTRMDNRRIDGNTNLGTVQLSDAAMQLNEVVVRAERTTVDIKLDKKVYNVGSDLLVKGGTVSDVLDNIPSVSVDSDGSISLRGNENVRILIDGRPSNAINITEALRLIPADAIDKVEVVTNPSARYESEGGGGLLNIILKKGKNQGLNGVIIANAGDPETYGVSANVNYKTKEFNLFTTTAYNHRTNLGRTSVDTEYLNSDNTTRNFINESRRNTRVNDGVNTNFGMEWYLDNSTTWTNSINYRRFSGQNPERVRFDNFDAAENFLFTNFRFNDQQDESEDVEYSTNFIKKFKRDGHQLTIDGAFSLNKDNDVSNINNFLELTANDQKQNRNTIQLNYVLPFGKDSQFEAGYKGDFNTLLTDFSVDTLDVATGTYNSDLRYTNTLEYKEKIHALYTQYGSKIKKFSYLFGVRWEGSDIDINQLATGDFNNKRYGNFFPSAFFTYELKDDSNISLSYSRRISRPRGRQINPFSNYSSNINIFQGNPDLDPAFTDAFDLGYLKRWKKLTLSTSAYLNRTTDAFQFVRLESGDFVTVNVDGQQVLTPVILTTPINLATDYRFGFEFTLNYNPYRWWRLNTNFNFFRNETQGDYTYVDFEGETNTQDFDNVAYSWSARVNSKVTLPYKIDWQTNVNYNAPQTNAQGRVKGFLGVNLAFSKDVLKDKGTIALNVQDVFNSRKRMMETQIPGILNSYSEMQWRLRTVNVSFTYRFNRQKNERDNRPRREDGGGDEDFGG